MTKKIETGKKVTLHFSLSNTDGDDYISTFDDEPETIVIGDGSMAAELEAVLIGLVENEDTDFLLAPDQAFGQPDPDNIVEVPLAEFQIDEDIAIGKIIGFNGSDNEEIPGLITDIQQNMATVDFNHPLAGVPVVFHVKILNID